MCTNTWKHADDNRLYEYLEGENIWQKDWKSIGTVKITDQRQNEEIEVDLWEVEINKTTKQFAAKEFSNNCWSFFIES